MADKQIIIDGVDIAGCEFAVKPINDNRIKCHCVKGLLQIAKMQEQPESIKSGLCENNHNCYYKQRKRKEQENKELKKELTSFMNGDYCDNGCSLRQQLNQLKQTLTEIKEIAGQQCNICEELTPIDEYKDCKKCWQGVILQKISECEVENDR